MKERPILFSTEMVKAILEGRKTQTRRIIKKQPHRMATEVIKSSQWRNGDFVARFKYHDEEKYQVTNILKCPYGQSGDRLWVRETFARTGDNFHDDWPGHGDYYYKADDPFSELEPGSPTKGIFKWRPSIFMPREACRIILEVTNMRVERLNDISEEDAMAEGSSFYGSGYRLLTAKEIYESLWESINGKGSWDKNPWVWVVSFRRIEP